MLNGRLYRAGFAPFVVVLAIAAFSLSARTHPLSSALAPDAFDGNHAFAELSSLAGAFPDRRPGSRADDALAARVAATLQGLGGPGSVGYGVRERAFSARTVDGVRTLRTVIATRPGSTSETPIVIVAHRDSSAAGPAPAELSGTAALLELARVFAARETKRTLVLVSTSGGSGGNAGAADFAAHYASSGVRGPLDAAVVLGDLAGASAHSPFVTGFSDGLGAAPVRLQRTLADAIARETGAAPGFPSAPAQVAHLAFHLAVGEQAPLDAAGIPALLVQRSGERAPPARDRVSEERLAGMGRGVLSAVDALDGGPDVPAAPQAGVAIQGMTLPEWAVRLLVLTLLLPPLFTAIDGSARARRRRAGRRTMRRATVWALSAAIPFAGAALFARLLGASGIVSVPAHPLGAGVLALDGAAVRTTSAVLLVLVLAWLAWPVLVRSVTLRVRPNAEVGGLALELVVLALAAVVWVANPYAALLLVPAAHLLLVLAAPELRPRPPAALAIVALAVLPVALLAAFFAHHLALGPGQTAWMAVSLVAGGVVGVPAALVWSAAAGCAVAGVLVALTPPPSASRASDDEPIGITIRGPLTYAGPGSL
ncbi:MAG TPA: M28 family peptidase [Solirubrobacteraceae bacterium]|nr:M28 family peptidase [Solirubrobacteraceae bacterium]